MCLSVEGVVEYAARTLACDSWWTAVAFFAGWGTTNACKQAVVKLPRVSVSCAAHLAAARRVAGASGAAHMRVLESSLIKAVVPSIGTCSLKGAGVRALVTVKSKL